MPPSPPPPWTTGDARSSPTVGVVLPTLNEAGNLPVVLEGLPEVDQVVIVDGGSTDGTVAVAREARPDAVIVRQTRTGKGNALFCGFAVCTTDIVITLDADGSADPGELPRYVDALLAGAEVAHGSRYRDGGGNLDQRRWDGIGNRWFNGLVNLLFGTRFTDLGCGYNAYWRAVLPVLDLPAANVAGLRRGTRLWGDGPEIEPLINIRAAAQGLRVVEVASVGYPPIYGVSQRHPMWEGGRALRAAATEYVRRWQIGRQASQRAGAHALRPAARSAGAPREARLRGGPLRPAQERWADARWAADQQQSWRDSYTDPGAAAGGPARQLDRPGPATGPVGSPIGSPAGGTSGTGEYPRSRHARRRPDLRVITGDGPQRSGGLPGEPPYRARPAHLRAVPGETYEPR